MSDGKEWRLRPDLEYAPVTFAETSRSDMKLRAPAIPTLNFQRGRC